MEVESIRHQLRTKDADIARLRGQRDVLKEESDTRKAQQAVSNQSVKDVEEFAKLQEVSLLFAYRDKPLVPHLASP